MCLEEAGHWRCGLKQGILLFLASSLRVVYHAVNSFAVPCTPTGVACLALHPETMEPTTHRQKLLNPWAKRNAPSPALIFSPLPPSPSLFCGDRVAQ